MKKYFVLAVLALAALAPIRPVFAQDKTIVEIAAGNADFSTLVSLVKAAGLAETLSGTGPFTVFAPTNAAFAKVKKSTLDKLGKNPAALKAVLTYHVVAGKVMAADVVKLKDGTKVKTVNGASITVGTKGGVKVDKAKVVKTDIVGSNGVIHVIDSVILPKGLKL
ncbi:fasciclin domain-containing protein [Armatimonas sp.]|uniref:fasciclin domain-containing protein n=1 Tax=Armatimonas sp. TaxID=1872638 RepID=UPI002869F4C3|nr:fasciclin domain-containing protein [Armatimonas sp.]